MIAQDQARRLNGPRSWATGPARRHSVQWPKFPSVYVVLHGIWLALYALLGKGFAYAGFPPLYVGEMLLVLAVFCLLSARRTIHLFATPIGLVLGLFVAWQAGCTVPYLGTYGPDALRDGAVWGYALFACSAAALTIRLPGLLSTVVASYGRFARFYLFAGPAAWLATLYLRDWLPHWPGTNVSIPLIKGGEMCVHLAGILAFVAVGLSRFSMVVVSGRSRCPIRNERSRWAPRLYGCLYLCSVASTKAGALGTHSHFGCVAGFGYGGS